MDFLVVDKINIHRDRCKKIGAFLYDPVLDGMYLESPWPFPVQIGITNHLTNCEITKGFLRLPFILKGWVNHDILLRMIDLIKLLDDDSILMHGSCYDDTLVVGLPNSGKTYQTYKSVAEGATLVSEEYTILKNGIASPYKPVMRTCFSERTLVDCNIPISFKERIQLKASQLRAAVLPFMFEGAIWKEIPVDHSEVRVERIAYGSTGRQVTDWKEFAILCENEFPFMASEFLQAYAIATGFDLLGIQEKQRGLIKNFVEQVYAVDNRSES